MRGIPSFLDIAARELRCGNREALRLTLRDLLRLAAQAPRQPSEHLAAAIDWIRRAHDAGGAGGVARSYCVAWNPSFRKRGWLDPYPETTGYIIPTLFDYARHAGDADARRRAVAMAEWEIEVQMVDGAVQGGMVGMPPSPAVFNTGQVIFGWLRAAAETGEQRFLDAAERAGRFLVEHLDDDGVWRRGLSRHARQGPQTYNTRTAWALLELAQATGERSFRDAGRRNIESALKRQLDNGWFEGNCLDNDEAPLTHTIAYATRGVLEAGALLGEEKYLNAARRSADALAGRQRKDGSLAGRYDRNWRPAVRWSCLTGNAQVSIIWLRLAEILGEPRYARAAERSLHCLCRLQDLGAPDDGVRGGIAGACPIYGDYGRYEYLNWAAKFFAEALLLLTASSNRVRPE